MFTFCTVFNGASFDLLTRRYSRSTWTKKNIIIQLNSVQFSFYDRSVLRMLYAAVQSLLDTVSEKHENIKAVLNISHKAKW